MTEDICAIPPSSADLGPDLCPNCGAGPDRAECPICATYGPHEAPCAHRTANIRPVHAITELVITGAVTGALYWPIGHPAAKPFHEVVNVEREGIPYRHAPRDAAGVYATVGDSLVGIIGAAVHAEGMDFSTAPRLTADTEITVRRTYGPAADLGAASRTLVTRERHYIAAELPSLVAAGLVALEAYTADFGGLY